MTHQFTKNMYCSQLDQSSKQTKKKEKTNCKGIVLIRGGGGRWMCSAPEGSELDLHLELSLNDNIASCLVCYSSVEGFVASSEEPTAFWVTEATATTSSYFMKVDLGSTRSQFDAI